MYREERCLIYNLCMWMSCRECHRSGYRKQVPFYCIQFHSIYFDLIKTCVTLSPRVICSFDNSKQFLFVVVSESSHGSLYHLFAGNCSISIAAWKRFCYIWDLAELQAWQNVTFVLYAHRWSTARVPTNPQIWTQTKGNAVAVQVNLGVACACGMLMWKWACNNV